HADHELTPKLRLGHGDGPMPETRSSQTPCHRSGWMLRPRRRRRRTCRGDYDSPASGSTWNSQSNELFSSARYPSSVVAVWCCVFPTTHATGQPGSGEVATHVSAAVIGSRVPRDGYSAAVTSHGPRRALTST